MAYERGRSPSMEVRRIVAGHASQVIAGLSAHFRISKRQREHFITKLHELIAHGRVQSTRGHGDSALAAGLGMEELGSGARVAYLRVHFRDKNEKSEYLPPHHVLSFRVVGPAEHKEALLGAARKFAELFNGSRADLLRLTNRSKLEIEEPEFEEPGK